ncbi:glycine cleavage T C-terminal barrel domain-containing protein [Streptomyces sp. NPDC054933]
MTNNHPDVATDYAVLREKCGMVDYTGTGLLRVSGPSAAAYLGRVSTRGVDFLLEGQTINSLVLRDNGTIVAETLIHCRATDYLMEIWPAQAKHGVAHLLAAAAAYEDLVVEDVSDQLAVLGVEGPQSFKIAQKYLPFPVASLGYRNFATAQWAGRHTLMVSRTGVTGEYGYKFLVASADAEQLCSELTELGAVRCAKAAVDVCRMEVRFANLEEESAGSPVTPFDVGLQWMLDVGQEFMGRTALLDAFMAGLTRMPVCWIAEDSLTTRPKQGTAITASDGEVGAVTHAVWSPKLERFIGSARVDAAIAASGQDFKLAGTDTVIRTVSAPFLTATSLDVPLD